MHALLMVAALTGCPDAEPAAYETFAQAAAEIEPTLQTGTLLVNRGDCLAIRVYTASPYTHVAAVVVENGRATVYDSMNGTGVRQLPLEVYLADQSPDRIHVFQPTRPFTTAEQDEFVAYLESQRGTPYEVKHFLTGREGEGIHCSEYVTCALMETGKLHADRPHRVSPASLMTGVTVGGLYQPGVTYDLELCEPEPEASNRCELWWLETKECMSDTCDRLQGWILCR